MASLHAPVAIAAATHSDIETAHDGPPDDLFLILGFAAFPFQAAAAMRTALRQGNRDSFIHARWGGTARLPAIAAAGFAAWALRIGFWVAPRMRGQPDAYRHATPLPVPAATAPLPFSGARSLSVAVRSAPAASRSPAAPDPIPVSEQTRYSPWALRRWAGQSVSSHPTVAETASFVQRKSSDGRFQRSLRLWLVNKYLTSI